MFTIRRILHPTDFSEYSQNAFHIAVDLARIHKASILVLHVARPLSEEQVSFGEASVPQPAEYHHRLAEAEREVTGRRPASPSSAWSSTASRPMWSRGSPRSAAAI